MAAQSTITDVAGTLKRSIGDEIERLINILDAIEGDTDLEETGDLEPSLANSGYCTTKSDEVDLEEDYANKEPTLGSLNQVNQTRWADHVNVGATWNIMDGELDDSDREDGGDTEPNGDELDGPDDNGIGDQDGMIEASGGYDGPPDRRTYYQQLQDREAARQAGFRLQTLTARLAGLPAPLAPPINEGIHMIDVDGYYRGPFRTHSEGSAVP